MMRWPLLFGAGLLTLTACTGAPPVSSPSRSSSMPPTPSNSATASPNNSVAAGAPTWCRFTVSVEPVHAQTPTDYPIGGVINVSVGQHLIVAGVDHCSPDMQATAKPTGRLRAIAGSPGVFVATSSGRVTVTVIHASCDGSPSPGCAGGIAAFRQSVLVHSPVA